MSIRMAMQPKWATWPYPQSTGNLALADESWDVFQEPKAKALTPQLRMVQGMREEVEIDVLVPMTGIINGICLSLTLWGLIVLIIVLMR